MSAGGSEGFDSAAFESLLGLADRSSKESEAVFNYDDERNRAKIDKLKNDNEMRKAFFAWASKLTIAIIGLNGVLFAAYLYVQWDGGHPIPESVMFAWVTSTIVEVLGIVAIIARYLFPGKRPAAKKVAQAPLSES